MTETSKTLSAVAYLLATIVGVACVESTKVPETAALILRNQRADSIASVYMTPCSAAEPSTADSLQVRDVMLPLAERSFSVVPGCYDLELRNPSDAIVDARTSLGVAGGDTLIVVLRQ